MRGPTAKVNESRSCYKISEQIVIASRSSKESKKRLALPSRTHKAVHGEKFMNQAIVDDLVTASHILADQGVLNGLGHISVRHPDNPQRYLMSRSLAPALVMPADIMEYDLDSKAIDR